MFVLKNTKKYKTENLDEFLKNQHGDDFYYNLPNFVLDKIKYNKDTQVDPSDLLKNELYILFDNDFLITGKFKKANYSKDMNNIPPHYGYTKNFDEYKEIIEINEMDIGSIFYDYFFTDVSIEDDNNTKIDKPIIVRGRFDFNTTEELTAFDGKNPFNNKIKFYECSVFSKNLYKQLNLAKSIETRLFGKNNGTIHSFLTTKKSKIISKERKGGRKTKNKNNK